MGIGDFAGGFTNAISQYLTGERERTRKAEDEEIDYQRDMIKMMIQRPDFNPAHLGKALHDLIDLGQGKAGKRKMKKGAEGFTGHTELPLSQFFQGMINNPVYGAPIPQAPQAPAQAQRAPVPSVGVETAVNDFPEFGDPFNKQPITNAVPGYPTAEEQGFTGESVLKTQVPVPPKGTYVPQTAKRMAGAAQQYEEGLLFRPEQLAQQKAQAEEVIGRNRAYGTQIGDHDANIEVFRGLGASDEDIRESLMNTGRRAADNFQEYVYMMPDGNRFSARVNLRTNETFDLQGSPLQLPSGAVRIGLGAPNQLNFFQDDAGRVSGAATNRYEPGLGTSTIPIAPGVRGRTSPDGPVAYVQGPDGSPVPARMPRQGSSLRPSPDPFTAPQPASGGNAPVVPQPPAAGGRSRGVGPGPAGQQQPQRFATQYRPPTESTLQQMDAAKNGLQVVAELKQLWQPRFTGTVQGPMNQITQRIPGVPADPEFRAFQTRWAEARNELLRTNAGLTQTAQEKKNTEEQIMNLNDKDPNFLVALSSLENYFIRKQATRAGSAGIGVPYNNANQAPQIRPIPGIPGGEATLINGRWVRTK